MQSSLPCRFRSNNLHEICTAFLAGKKLIHPAS